MIAQDFLFDDDGDLKIVDGDFVVGESDLQHVEDLILSGPGWYKEFKELGVNAQQYIGSSGRQQEIERNIRLNLQADGFNVNRLRVQQLSTGLFKINDFDAIRNL